MRNLRKTSILFCTLILGLFTACNLGLINKTGQLYFDFSEFSTAKNKNSRTVLEDVIEEGKNYYIDLSIEGSYKYNTTINLQEINTYTIDNIPAGSKIKASLVLYTYNYMGDPDSKEIVLTGESKFYTITKGVNEIAVNMKNKFVILYVTYSQEYQNNNFENEDPSNDGKTPSTAFYYIQSAINWIAQNGNQNKDYKIKLIDYDSDHPFTQKINFGKDYDDYLRYKANSITLTSENRYTTAWTPTSNSNNIYVCTWTPIYLQDIKIVSNGNTILTLPDTNHQNITCNVFLGNGTVFENSADTSASAISIDNGSVTMTGNAQISNFKATYGGAVSIGAGDFIMKDNSKIKNCSASSYGGAIYLNGIHTYFSLNDNATIENCSAGSEGGAIYHKGSSVTINSGNIINCKAGSNGGAIYVDTSSHDLRLVIHGGIIKNNQVLSETGKGSAIYLGQIDRTATFIMADDACIDISNDIYSSGQAIQLENSLKTNGRAGRITWKNTLSDNYTIIKLSDYYDSSDSDIIKNSAPKFYIDDSDPTTHFYLSNEGKTVTFNEFLSVPTDINDEENQIQISDIVFADNSRIRPDSLAKIDYTLYSSIAGIVFYIGSESGFLGNVNLIVGTETFEGNFEKQAYGGTSEYPHFDLTQITSFPYYLENYVNGTNLVNTNSMLISDIKDDKYISVGIGNTGITEFLMTKILDGSFPLYKEVINYGAQKKFSFDGCKYKSNTATDYTNNWYIPAIEEYIVFSKALDNSTFKSLYMKISNSTLTGDYISETMMWKTSWTLPPSYYSPYDGGKEYPYNFGINFIQKTIIQLVTPPFNYYKKVFPIHIYDPTN